MKIRNPIPAATVPAPMRSVILATLALLLAAPVAAADVTLELAPEESRYGSPTEVTGTVTDAAGAPLAGLEVTLAGRRYPFKGEFRSLERTTTDAEGAYRFEREFERNWQVRVLA